MYWFREFNLLGFIPFALAALVWTLGGWLIATHAFDLPKRQRLLVGFGLGLVIYLWLLNLIGGWFEIRLAYLLPALLVFVFGILYFWKSDKPFLDWEDLKVSPFLIFFIGLFIYSVLLERGLGIYDDYHHLPAISAMGAGNLPPRYMLNAAYDYSYHYGFELLGGSLMQLGNLFPWSAFDLGKTIVWVYSLVLVAFLLNQYLEKTWKVFLGVVLFLFMGGTRYLMMLLPASFLQTFDKAITFSGVSQDLNLPFSKILFAQWSVGGGPPQPYIYGLTNSLNSPYILNHMGEFPLALIILVLLWFLADKFTSYKAIPFIAILFAHLALTYESTYGLIMVSLVLAVIYLKFIRKKVASRTFWFFLVAAAISIPFAVLQGGSLFSIFKGVFEKAVGSQSAIIIHPNAESVFSFQWPPSISTAHFGALSIFSLPQLIVGLFEIGPIIFFTPSITKWVWNKFKQGEWILGVVVISTWVGFIISMLVSYNLSERDITRFNKHALLFWNLFFIIILLQNEKTWNKWSRGLAIFCTGLMLVTGIFNAWIQQSALTRPVLSDGIDGLDSQVTNQVWGRLDQKDLIFDPGSNDWRATAVTGLLTASSMNRETTPLWNQLSRNPSLEGYLQNGFRFLYVDQGWWRSLTDAQRTSLSNPCIKTIASASMDDDFLFRKLLDMGPCSINQ
jgi:hypothetical protein